MFSIQTSQIKYPIQLFTITFTHFICFRGLYVHAITRFINAV